MSLRWTLAGCLLLTTAVAAFPADTDTISAPEISTPYRDIPILTATGQDGNTADHFQVTINPLVAQRAPDSTGVLADSANEYVDFGWHMPIFSMFSIGYDTGVNAFRQDQTIWDDEEATSEVTTALINKGSFTVQSGSNVNLTGYVQTQRSLTDGQPGFSDADKYGTDLSWAPVKNVTTVKADASTQETYNFNGSFLDEDLYTASLDQKLPYVPLTLHTAGSVTDDTAPLLPANDKDDVIINASLLWKIVPSTSVTTGYQQQQASTPATLQLADTDVYFAQVSLQSSRDVTLTVRAAHEQTDTTAASQFLSTNSDVLFTFGLTWNLGDRFNLGAGLSYRALQSQTPTPTVTPPPTTISLSAGGRF